MWSTEKHELCTKEIPGYPGVFAREDGMILDNEGDFLMQFPLNADGHLGVTVEGNPRYVHRLVALAHVVNPCPGLFKIVDHINGNEQWNDQSNLRWVTQGLNCLNRQNTRNAVFVKKFRVKFMKNGKHCSFLKSWSDGNGRWQAYCTIRKKRHNLGYYKTFLEAHLAAKSFRDGEFERIYEEHKREYAARRAASFIPWLP